MSVARFTRDAVAALVGGIGVVVPLWLGLPQLYWRCDSCSWLVVAGVTLIMVLSVQLVALFVARSHWKSAGGAMVVTTLIVLALAYWEYPSTEPWDIVNLVYPMIPSVAIATLLALTTAGILAKRGVIFGR